MTQVPDPQIDSILSYLEWAEAETADPHLQDDIRIAWLCVLLAARGAPNPHVLATYEILGVHPDKVFPKLEQMRRAKLGTLYETFYPSAALPPRKTPQRAVAPPAVKAAHIGQ